MGSGQREQRDVTCLELRLAADPPVLDNWLARAPGAEGDGRPHVVIDGAIRNPARGGEPADAPDSHLDPDAIARAYRDLLRQDRSAWTTELELRPWVERF